MWRADLLVDALLDLVSPGSASTRPGSFTKEPSIPFRGGHLSTGERHAPMFVARRRSALDAPGEDAWRGVCAPGKNLAFPPLLS